MRDKDGIRRGGRGCDLAAGLKAAGPDLLDRLDELAVAHGVHLHRGGVGAAGAGSPGRGGGPAAAAPPAGWTRRAAGPATCCVLRRPGERLVIRPSGTEPKLKAYLEVVEPGAGGRGRSAPRGSAAQARLDALRAEVEPLLSG